MDSGEQERTFDEIFDAFSHVQRRKLLRALLIHNPQDDDSVVINADESMDEEFTRLVEMQHIHLPKLEDYGFIDWNEKTNEVSKGPNFEEIRPLLELLVDHEDELPDGWL
jgi:hypothetical protein